MIDLRSDWVAPPTPAMWEAMRRADAPALAELEERAATLLGKEAAVWTPTCTAANLAALLTLAEPGERVALQPEAHILTTEGMGIAHLARLEPIPLERADEAAVVCLENTHTRAGGTALGVGDTTRLAALAPRSHLDGARLPNAAAALGRRVEATLRSRVAALAAPVDTVALSLNKGLGAPAGAVLAGAVETIAEARVHLRRLGAASLHQAFVLAAAGLVALELLDRIGEDNRRARRLAEGLGGVEGVDVEPPETNLVFFSVEGWNAAGLVERLEASGVRGCVRDERRVRFVTHLGVADGDVARAVAAVAAVVTRARSGRSAGR